eukprot:scaffold107848_cov60-Phaeocystis_antarctica.AAC.2
MGPSKKNGTPRTRTVTPTHVRSGAAARLSRTTAAHARRGAPMRALSHSSPRAADSAVGQPCFSTTCARSVAPSTTGTYSPTGERDHQWWHAKAPASEE